MSKVRPERGHCMPPYKPRNTYFHVNKYQRRILIFSLLPLLSVFTLISLVIVYCHQEAVSYLLYATHPPSVQIVNKWGAVSLAVLWVVFIIILIGTYHMSSNLVGAFERILRELDHSIFKRERRQLRARIHDDLANELIKRINRIISDPIPRTGDNQDKG